MPTPAGEIVVEERIAIAASTEHVWQALVDSVTRAGWWSYLELDPRLGGRFEERWEDADGNLVRTQGQVLEVVEGRLLRLNWADDSWDQSTEVEVRVEDADHGAWVRVRHTGWDSLPDGTTLAAQHRDGWMMHLENLRSHLEDRAGGSPGPRG